VLHLLVSGRAFMLKDVTSALVMLGKLKSYNLEYSRAYISAVHKLPENEEACMI